MVSSHLPTQAQTGFSNAADYDAYRPSYPPEAVSKLLAHLNVLGVKNARIIDLACGTGKFTELLVMGKGDERKEDFEVLGIEPHDEMREVLLKKHLEGVKVLKGDAENMPIEDGWGDALIAAQAFHWFATEKALKEINRILKPGAAFGMIWNIEDYNAPIEWPATTKWEQKLKDILVTLDDGHPRFRNLKWKDVFDRQQDTNPLQTIKDQLTGNLPSFSLPIGEEDVKWTVWLNDEAIWSRYSTLSQIANLDMDKKESLREEVLIALKEDDTVRNAKGEIALNGRTHLAWTSRV